MAYLNNTTTTVDAILTKKGRELLAKGKGLNITKFAVSDDEIDYGLYDTSHPLGTNYFGSAIENMPILEAVPDETQAMRYKLVTLPKGTKEIPIIKLGVESIALTAGTSTAFPIRPSTKDGLNGPGFGYTAILYDSDAAVLTGTGLPESSTATIPVFLSDAQSAAATVAVGTEFTLTPRDVRSTVNTSLTIVGNQTGASKTITVTVDPDPTRVF